MNIKLRTFNFYNNLSLKFFSKTWQEKARATLQNYLDSVLVDDRLNQSEIVYSFLSPSPDYLKTASSLPPSMTRYFITLIIQNLIYSDWPFLVDQLLVKGVRNVLESDSPCIVNNRNSPHLCQVYSVTLRSVQRDLVIPKGWLITQASLMGRLITAGQVSYGQHLERAGLFKTKISLLEFQFFMIS